MYRIIQTRKIWLSFSTILIVLSILSLSFWGLKLGIDFTGGTLIELEFKTERPANQQIADKLAELDLTNLTIQPTGERGVVIRTINFDEQKHQQLLVKINELSQPVDQGEQEKVQTDQSQPAVSFEGEGLENLNLEIKDQNGQNIADLTNQQNSQTKSFEELRFDSIGPIIGKELQTKTLYAIVLVLIFIILYIAYAFRKVSKPVESWKYGLSATIALVHDILIVVGLFSVLGHFFDIQTDSLFVTALLTILGFSIHDTIVTFDRIRENLHRRQDQTFENVINISINETIVRSLNTTLTTIFVLLSTFLFGGSSIRNFALALIAGLIIGTYSSIFIASPTLLFFYKLKKY